MTTLGSIEGWQAAGPQEYHHRRHLGLLTLVPSDTESALSENVSWFNNTLITPGTSRQSPSVCWRNTPSSRRSGRGCETKLIGHFEEEHPDWFAFEWLPAYAPELNPVEECWNHTRYADLPHFIPDDLDDLQTLVRESMLEQRQDRALLHSFFAYARLPL
ncbi:MAG: transposase [Pirellulales bacterium]|nr:transposase [Pirellulales bacterium]